jgi:hypothetical protein
MIMVGEPNVQLSTIKDLIFCYSHFVIHVFEHLLLLPMQPLKTS